MTLDVKLPAPLRQDQPVKQPAKRWRNWWAPAQTLTWTDGLVGARCAEPVHPTKDVAETFAEKIKRKYCGLVKYLGAFPDDERPS